MMVLSGSMWEQLQDRKVLPELPVCKEPLEQMELLE
jgi:hypothetical protein